MKFTALLVALALAPSTLAIRILLANDDSWASANIRATFEGLTNAGHDVVLVGCASNGFCLYQANPQPLLDLLSNNQALEERSTSPPPQT